MSLLAPSLVGFPILREDVRAAYPDITDIIVGAFVITPPAAARSKTTISRVLLLHRSLTWDFPGERFKTSDKTMVDAIAREVLEETGLHVNKIVAFVGINYWTKPKGPERKWGKFCFVVGVEEQDGSKEEFKTIPIKLSPGEHDGFYWAKKEEVKNGPQGDKGPFVFIGNDQGGMISESFSKLG